MIYAVVAAVVLGAVSTFGDYVWAALRLRHEMTYGLIHGAVICFCIGAVIGIRDRRLLPALIAGPVIGLIAAGAFYALAPWLRYSAMFPAWMLFWICFALLQEWLGSGRRSAAPAAAVSSSFGAAVARGLAAAVLSGLAFYAISGIWTRPSPGGPNYLRHFLSWSFAFLPGFVALFAGQRVVIPLPRRTTN
jgi:hypothetical protein